MSTKSKPTGGKSKKASKKQTANDFSFIPPVGIFCDERQFTKDGWEKVQR